MPRRSWRRTSSRRCSRGSWACCSLGNRCKMDKSMRPTAELIKELADFDPGGPNDLAFLAVLFDDDHAEYVNSPIPDRLAKLNEEVRRGGRPIGVIRLVALSKRPGEM